MPIRRLDWPGAVLWPQANPLLKERFEQIDRQARLAIGPTITGDGLVHVGSSHTLLKVDTTGGPVSLDLPPSRTVFESVLRVKVVAGTDPVTLVANGSETIEGNPDVSTTTTLCLVADAQAWWVL